MSLRWVALLLLVGCECGGSEAAEPSEPAAAPATLSAYFPSAKGDRWLYAAGEDRVIRTILDADPTDTSPRKVLMVGYDLMGPRYHQVSDEGVQIVGPEGEVLATVLDTPLQQGHEWSYVFGEVKCEAKYTAVDETVEVAGLTLEGCVAVERTCTHPAGKPFPVETQEIHHETYCANVGRVRERSRVVPPPPGSETAERDDRLVFYRVVGSPAPEVPERFDCDAFLIASTDVVAACGRGLAQVRAESGDESCQVTFATTPAGPPVVVAARRLEREATQADADALVTATAASLETEELASYGYLHERFVLAVAAPTEVCASDSLDRLGPLVQSLVRR